MLPRLERYIQANGDSVERSSQLVEFAQYIAGIVDALNISPESIHGRMLLIGCGSSASPEVILFSSDMLASPVPIQENISHVTALDLGSMVLSSWDFDPQEKITTHEYISQHDFVSSRWDGEPFDVIFMLRTNNLDDQLQVGLDKDIAKVLHPEGMFICSGNERARTYLNDSAYLTLNRSANVDAYSYPYYLSVTHTAFVATKK